MTSFVHPEHPTTHRGVDRLQHGLDNMRSLGERFSGARGLVALVLAGAFSALVVVADQIVGSWADGQVVVAWMALWVVLFVAVLLFTEASRGWAETAAKGLEARAQAWRRRIEDERTWRFALDDPRFMAELQVARMRAEEQAADAGQPKPAWPFDHMPPYDGGRRFL